MALVNTLMKKFFTDLATGGFSRRAPSMELVSYLCIAWRDKGNRGKPSDSC
jgi:hypothetical protein